MNTYIGMISSDWSQCLSPNGPFDPLIFLFPELKPDLTRIFKRYTGNEITLGRAVDQVSGMLPEWPTPDQMDAYMDASFATYTGVAEFIRWCGQKRILFMINTTGFMGYFQRAISKTLLPPVDVLSAQSRLRFNPEKRAPGHMIDLHEVEDKAHNTAAIAERFSIPHHKIVLIGDSGGDGPHFEWGAKSGATLIGSMTKPSLDRYCRNTGVSMHHQVGHTYHTGESISAEKESHYDFRFLIDIVQRAVDVDG